MNPTSDAHVEPNKATHASEDETDDENICKGINAPKQNSNLSSSRGPICNRRPIERHRSFIQYANTQTKDANDSILIGKRKIEKSFLY